MKPDFTTPFVKKILDEFEILEWMSMFLPPDEELSAALQ